MKCSAALILILSLNVVLRGAEPARSGSRQPVISFLVTEGAFSGPLKEKEGWVFYKSKEPLFQYPVFIGCSYHRGQAGEELVTGSSSGSARVLKEVESVRLEPFDWSKELELARERFGEAHKDGESVFAEPTSLDGAEWEIVISTSKGEFQMKAWNPGPLIDFYAPYNDKIGRLKRIIDILALSRGRRDLGL